MKLLLSLNMSCFCSFLSLGLVHNLNVNSSFMLGIPFPSHFFSSLRFSFSLPLFLVFSHVFLLFFLFPLIFLFISSLQALGVIGPVFLCIYVPNVVYRDTEPVPPLVPSMRLVARSSEFKQIFVVTVCILTAVVAFGNSFLYLLTFNYNIATVAGATNTLIILLVFSVVIGLLSNFVLFFLLGKMEKLWIFRKILLTLAVMVCNRHV